ncbi:hypothetical protein [Crenothrix polyspora]|uniref:Uncharacterized protein n=1 Tax=Crenothrix polyspora TaxID=360316 RepID=A0A1R4H1C6_9GAMM|nr:hypothetical protein [Crenothrix polyspora]SJM90002.1 hypothetical protein CRENPOLYSF1_1290019 [Crenothrix polyspora]
MQSNRDIKVVVYVNDAEYAELQRIATAHRLSSSAAARYCFNTTAKDFNRKRRATDRPTVSTEGRR